MVIVKAATPLEALEALGVIGGGYCFCYGGYRDPDKPDDQHSGECREAREVIRKSHEPIKPCFERELCLDGKCTDHVWAMVVMADVYDRIAVAIAPCDSCRVNPGEQCRSHSNNNSNNGISGTHYVRRQWVQRWRRSGHEAEYQELLQAGKYGPEYGTGSCG